MKTNFKKEYEILRKFETTILAKNKEKLTYKREDFYNIPWKN
jgi:hypothetical protein